MVEKKYGHQEQFLMEIHLGDFLETFLMDDIEKMDMALYIKCTG